MYDLIKGEIEKIRRKYIDSAEEIVSGYNREEKYEWDIPKETKSQRWKSYY